MIRHVLSLAVAAAAATTLAACAEAPRPDPFLQAGVSVPPPRGWTDYCSRHRLSDPACTARTIASR